jgi:hypothetical protein
MSVMKLPALSFCALLTLNAVAGCKGEKAGEAPGMPGYRTVNPKGEPAVAPSQAARVVGADGNASQPSGSMPNGAQGLPPGHPPINGSAAMAPGGDAPGGGSLSGTIELDPARAADVKPGSTLFLIVRQDAGGQDGMLLASKKLAVTGPDMFPLDFEITKENVMMPGVQLQGEVRVRARIDGDGDAGTKNPGDVTGAAEKSVPVGTSGITVKLTEKL